MGDGRIVGCRIEILVRITLELVEASGAAEVIGALSVNEAVRRRRRIDRHAADRVGFALGC